MTDPIHGRLTPYHSRIRRDFAVVAQPNERHSVFRPNLYLSFNVGNNPVQYHVAVGSFYSRYNPGPAKTLIGVEEHSQMIVLRNTMRPVIAGIDRFQSAAYCVPFFDWADCPASLESGDHVYKYWLLNPYVDRELHFVQMSEYWPYQLR